MAASTSRSGGGGHRNPLPVWPKYMAQYEPLARLGSGMNGEVFKAWDTKESRIVAVKRLSATGTDGGDFLISSSLLEVCGEYRSLKACDDIPSVVKVYDKRVPAVPKEGRDSFLVMEYAGRLNLRDYMKLRDRRRRRSSEAEVRRIMKPLLEGVSGVHGKGIMHMEIKPENVIVDDGTEDRTKMRAIHDGELKEEDIVCKIAGFGMARRKERGPTQPQVIITGPYSAPELLLHSCEYDERVDMWGLGCIMADLLSGTGKPTFDCDDDKDKEKDKDKDKEDEIRSKVFSIVDPKSKGIKGWAGYQGIAAELKSKLPGKKIKRKPARMAAGLKTKLFGKPLRRRFPLWKLSSAGFKVLSGLLESNPAKRLTAAEALEKPWFQERE